MAAEVRRRGAERICQLVVLGDGAAWIPNLGALWRYASQHRTAAKLLLPLIGFTPDRLARVRQHRHEPGFGGLGAR